MWCSYMYIVMFDKEIGKEIELNYKTSLCWQDSESTICIPELQALTNLLTRFECLGGTKMKVPKVSTSFIENGFFIIFCVHSIIL